MAIKLNRIHQTDCLKGLTRLEAGSVDLAFADPPFNIGYDYDEYDDRKDCKDYLGWCKQWMEGVIKALKPDGTFWLAIGDEYAAELKVIATRELGLHCRSWVVWYYTFGVNCKMNFSRSHTHLFHFVKDPKKYTFNHQDPKVRVPSARQLVYGDSRANPNGRLPDNTWILRPQDLPEGFQPDEDTWYFPRVCGTFKERKGWHGCQMPEQLLGRIIRACSNEGELVLDPFGGSGTTLAVAKKLGREFVGFELSEKYADQIRKRLGSVKPGDPLDGVEKPLTSVAATKDGKKLSDRKTRKPGRPRKQAASQTEALALAVEHKLLPPLAPLQGFDGDVSEGIRRAYLAASQGFSSDRVITDPILNADFAAACRDLRLPGAPADWNHALLGLRKASRLKGLPKARRTAIAREELDGFTFASEIAWALLSDGFGISLDHILCDPQHAGEFDRIARRLAPGWTPFHYRWGALYLRKEAFKKRSQATRIDAELAELTFKRPRDAADWGNVPSKPGVYLLKDSKENYYLGETFDLRSRIQTQTSADAMAAMSMDPAAARLAVLPLEVDVKQRWGIQSRLLRAYRPRTNWTKQFAA